MTLEELQHGHDFVAGGTRSQPKLVAVRMFMKVRLAAAARPDDRHEFTAMNFDGDSAERMHPRLAQFVILVRVLYTNNGARGNPETWF